MSPSEWYYAKNDQQIGPVSAAQLKQLAEAGELRPDALVWREGMEEWVEARNVKGLFEATGPKEAEIPPKVAELPAGAPRKGSSAAQFDSVLPGVPGQTALDRLRRRPGSHLFDVLLGAVRAQFTAQFIDATSKLFVNCGHYGLYLAMAVGFGIALIAGVKEDSLDIILLGTIAVLIVAVLQYAARRFRDALDRLNQTTSGTVSSMAFLDCFALLCMAIGAAILIRKAVVAIRSEEYAEIVLGLVYFILYQYLAFIALNPKTLSISVAPEARVGEEAIGVVSFLLKAVLRLVPVAFGVGVIYATLMLLYAGYLTFDKEAMATVELVEISDVTVAQLPTPYAKACNAARSILYCAALPFSAYLCFLLYYLVVDVIRAILVIPGKLDRLADREQD